MKRNYICVLLLVTGIVLLCVSVIPAIIETVSSNIIGGADIYTFGFVFFHKNAGMYSVISFLGIAAFIAAVVIKIVSKRK